MVAQCIDIGGNPEGKLGELFEMIEKACPDDMDESAGALTVEFHEEDPYCIDIADLKSFLRIIGIPYDHFIEGKWGYNACVRHWRPGYQEEKFSYANQMRNQLVHIAEIENAIDENPDMRLQDFLWKIRIPDLPEWQGETRLLKE